MAALGDNVGILLRIKADSSDAQADIKKFKAELQGIEKAANNSLSPLENLAAQSGLTAEQFTNLKIGALAAVAGIGAIVGVAVGVTAALAKLIVTSAEFGSTLYDASRQTGLSAKSISALKLAADSSGSSLESVSAAVSKLNVLVGNAAAGNEKAQATLAKYGITAKDTNEAFNQAVKVIGDMSSQTEKAAASAALFKDRTGAFLPVIDQVNGNFKEYIKNAERLGVVLSEEDLRAADEFGDTLGVLGSQAAAVGQKFAFELMPKITRAMNTSSDAMADNSDIARDWAKEVLYTVQGVETSIQALPLIIAAQFVAIDNLLGTNAQSWFNWKGAVINAILATLGPFGQLILAMNAVGHAQGTIFGRTAKLGGEEMELDPETGTLRPVRRPDKPPPDLPPGVKPPKDAKNDKRSAELAAQQAIARDLAAQIGIETINLRTIQDELAKTFENIRQEFRNTDDVQKFFDASKQGMDRFSSALQTSLTWLEQLERQQLRADASENERALLQAQQQERRQRIIKIGQEEYEKNQKELDEAEKRRFKDAEERFQRELNWTKQLMKAEQDRLEILKQLPAPDSVLSSPESFGIDMTAGLGDPKQLTAMDELIDRWDRLKASMEGVVGMQNILAGLGNFAIDMFVNMTNAVGSAVAAWALYGESIGKALKKALAAELAHIAAVATINALYATALGFLRLAQWDFEGAANAFISAGLWAALAAGSALAAKAVAGNSFRQNTSGGGAGANAANEPAAQRNNFTTPFRGFDETLNRQNAILGQLEETVHQFNKKTAAFSPGEIVGIGATDASGEIRKAYEMELGNDVGTTDVFFRNTGQAI